MAGRKSRPSGFRAWAQDNMGAVYVLGGGAAVVLLFVILVIINAFTGGIFG